MDERADGRERVVELVAHDADDLLPDFHFLALQLRRQALDDDQAVLLRVQLEAAVDDAEGLFLAARARAPATSASSSASSARASARSRTRAVLQREACEPLAPPEELARGGVGVGDALTLVDQQDRHRRSLQQRVEEELALVDLVSLGAERPRAGCRGRRDPPARHRAPRSGRRNRSPGSSGPRRSRPAACPSRAGTPGRPPHRRGIPTTRPARHDRGRPAERRRHGAGAPRPPGRARRRTPAQLRAGPRG